MTDERKPDPAGNGGGEEPSLGLDLGPATAAAPVAATPYRVLARKYRPASFADLIGQEAMVRTLSNAFELGRVHQAYLLTGVRGVGKTTTARILARAFNYELPAAEGHPAVTQPTVDMPELGVHCQAIIDSRHLDVIEMDAASHTGVDDVREIIENARFRPVMARTKVYIIDEVHMLSKNAFNALLKTLEEPPEHVKFLFATTEIEKVPVTVRSRCLRFDLRRIEPDVMIRHLAGICEKEQVAIEPEALSLIARAAEGSVRDALSLLDQAIAHGASGGHASISAVNLRAMLGVADRGRIIDLFDAVMKGDVAAALAILREQYDQGADPAHVLIELAEFVHFVTRFKVAPDTRMDAATSPEEFSRGQVFAQTLTLPVLTRAWQLLLKGLQDLKDSPRPLASADMVLVRLAHAADLPTPDDLLRRLASGEASAAAAPRAISAAGPAMATTDGGPPARPVRAAVGGSDFSAPRALAAAVPVAPASPSHAVGLATFADVVALAGTYRDIQLRTALERDVRLVRFDRGSIEFSLVEGAPSQIAQTLQRRLLEWTGERWMITVAREGGAPSLHEQAQAREQETLVGVRALPLVRSVLEHFPGAEIVAIRKPEAEAAPTSVAPIAPPPADAGEDIGYTDDFDDDNDDL